MKKVWSPTEGSFQQFLVWLDEGASSNGDKYLEMRRRLVAYFDHKNCLTSEELADETLSRVAQKLQEKGAITDLSPAHYCYVTAKFVFLEYVRANKRAPVALDERINERLPRLDPVGVGHGEMRDQEQVFDCLHRCLKSLPTGDSQLILDYYRGEQREKIAVRRQLSEKLGLSANALTIRACRVRNKLESCVKECCSRK